MGFISGADPQRADFCFVPIWERSGGSSEASVAHLACVCVLRSAATKPPHVRARAERLGCHQQDFAYSLRDLNPIDCIDGIHFDSLAFGAFDRYVRASRRLRLAEKAESHLGRDKNNHPTARQVRRSVGKPMLQQWWLSHV